MGDEAVTFVLGERSGEFAQRFASAHATGTTAAPIVPGARTGAASGSNRNSAPWTAAARELQRPKQTVEFVEFAPADERQRAA